jgi:hypothetical protein
MKYYESTFDEYLHSADLINLHPEISPVIAQFPKTVSDFRNILVYGPTGVGKYTQVLQFIRKYSASDLKHDKRISVQTDKQEYKYHISDIHYEIDMSILGCNSKILWHEIFLQIVDIVSIKPEKVGIILCKNFHLIHAELLEIFYSYMQEHSNPQSKIQLKFILITEHISFIPNPILNSCLRFHISRPSNQMYSNMVLSKEVVKMEKSGSVHDTVPSLANAKRLPPPPPTAAKSGTRLKNRIVQVSEPAHLNHHSKDRFFANISMPKVRSSESTCKTMEFINDIDMNGLLNAKELRSFDVIVKTNQELPKDIFNIICDSLIAQILLPQHIVFPDFRDILYDILIYNLDVSECIWYILSHFIHSGHLSKSEDISSILEKLSIFLKYYNNNYRPIYHLESIFFTIINKIHGYEL